MGASSLDVRACRLTVPASPVPPLRSGSPQKAHSVFWPYSAVSRKPTTSICFDQGLFLAAAAVVDTAGGFSRLRHACALARALPHVLHGVN